MSQLALDAEALYADLLAGVRAWLAARAALEPLLVGVWSGGAWLAERLHQDLARPGRPGVVSSALHRDDYAARGLAATGATALPGSLEGRHILLVDDVLHTGRTTRAVLNELFDFGRPASVTLAVLVDRVGRELPVEAALSAARLTLPAGQRLALDRDAAGRFRFDLEDARP